jgi:hypothetical protein
MASEALERLKSSTLEYLGALQELAGQIRQDPEYPSEYRETDEKWVREQLFKVNDFLTYVARREGHLRG